MIKKTELLAQAQAQADKVEKRKLKLLNRKSLPTIKEDKTLSTVVTQEPSEENARQLAAFLLLKPSGQKTKSRGRHKGQGNKQWYLYE